MKTSGEASFKNTDVFIAEGTKHLVTWPKVIITKEMTLLMCLFQNQ